MLFTVDDQIRNFYFMTAATYERKTEQVKPYLLPLGNFVSSILDENDIRVRRFAKICGISPGHVSYITQAKKEPSRELLHQVASGLSEISGNYVDIRDLENLIHKGLWLEKLKQEDYLLGHPISSTEEHVCYQELIDIVTKRIEELGEEGFRAQCEVFHITSEEIEAAREGYFPSEECLFSFSGVLRVSPSKLKAFVKRDRD